MKITGKYNSAKIYTEYIDSKSLKQIYTLLNNPGFADSQIAIMPDVHVGKGSVIGFTMTLNKYIIPTVVGVDIGCGIAAYNLGDIDINFEEFDSFIRTNIPSGRKTHSSMMNQYFSPSSELQKMISKICPKEYARAMCSIGTLGGGNHFIELGKDNENNIWLFIHSGSRNLGLQVCNYHQTKAKIFIKKVFKGAGAYHGLEYMTMDGGGNEYLNDMKTAQEYAELNRTVMSQIIIEKYFSKKLSDCEKISNIHNYVNFKDKIIRKGAISAHAGEKLVIPLNMRDGSIIAAGKGNEKWNYSAPHGAGRIFSRSESRKNISLNDFKESMKGIYSTSVNNSTIDESPMAYKSAEHIISLIHDTVEINSIVLPVYNFKAGN